MNIQCSVGRRDFPGLCRYPVIIEGNRQNISGIVKFLDGRLDDLVLGRDPIQPVAAAGDVNHPSRCSHGPGKVTRIGDLSPDT